MICRALPSSAQRAVRLPETHLLPPNPSLFQTAASSGGGGYNNIISSRCELPLFKILTLMIAVVERGAEKGRRNRGKQPSLRSCFLWLWADFASFMCVSEASLWGLSSDQRVFTSTLWLPLCFRGWWNTGTKPCWVQIPHLQVRGCLNLTLLFFGSTVE